MKPGVFLNGRFLSLPVSGVQRFSDEITAAIDRLSGQDEWPETTILIPRISHPATVAPSADLHRQLRFMDVGRTRGHLWEQTELPAVTLGDILVSLRNTAPQLAGSRQIVVIHNAGVFDAPESYAPCFRARDKTLQHALGRASARAATVSEFSCERIAARRGLDRSCISMLSEGADHILRQPADLRAFYESAVCLLFPSRYEGFSLPLVKAMACSCPVLASRGGVVEDVR